MAPESAAWTSRRAGADIAAVDRNDGQHDHHTGADSPGFHRDSANSGDDQDTGEVQTVEPLAGSHGRSFGTEEKEEETEIGATAPSIFVGVTLTRSPGCST